MFTRSLAVLGKVKYLIQYIPTYLWIFVVCNGVKHLLWSPPPYSYTRMYVQYMGDLKGLRL